MGAGGGAAGRGITRGVCEPIVPQAGRRHPGGEGAGVERETQERDGRGTEIEDGKTRDGERQKPERQEKGIAKKQTAGEDCGRDGRVTMK